MHRMFSYFHFFTIFLHFLIDDIVVNNMEIVSIKHTIPTSIDVTCDAHLLFIQSGLI